jgi:hypothetical protein
MNDVPAHLNSGIKYLQHFIKFFNLYSDWGSLLLGDEEDTAQRVQLILG